MDEENRLVPIPVLPPGFLERLAEDPNAGAITAMGLQGLAVWEKNQIEERKERKEERNAELDLKRLAAQERKEKEDRAERERAAQRKHELDLWKGKQRFILIFGALLGMAVIGIGVYLLVATIQTGVGASIVGAAAAVLIGLAQRQMQNASANLSGADDSPKKQLPAPKPETGQSTD